MNYDILFFRFLQPGRSASKRGVGVQFGPDVTKEFCENNNLGEVQCEVYKIHI